MYIDYVLTRHKLGWVPTILPDVPGGKERSQVSLGLISRDLRQTSGGVFRRQCPK